LGKSIYQVFACVANTKHRVLQKSALQLKKNYLKKTLSIFSLDTKEALFPFLSQ
jgi:hypothetical protein